MKDCCACSDIFRSLALSEERLVPCEQRRGACSFENWGGGLLKGDAVVVDDINYKKKSKAARRCGGGKEEVVLRAEIKKV